MHSILLRPIPSIAHSSAAVILLPCLLLLLILPEMSSAMPSSSSANASTTVINSPSPPAVIVGAENVSSHVLDIANGRPAQGVALTAYKLVQQRNNGSGERWTLWGQTVTDARGRIPIVHPGQPLSTGIFKLHFHTGDYFQRLQQQTFYPYIDVVFQVNDPNVHYHVPITLSNFGYSTYKGQ